MKKLLLALAICLAATTAYGFNLPFAPGTATATGNGTTTAAATLNQDAGTITTEALTTAAAGVLVITVNCNQVTPNTILSVELANGTNSAGDPSNGLVTVGTGVFTVAVTNRHASAAFNGTLKLYFIVFN